MDDIRRPDNQRRDFAMRHRAHQPAQPKPEPPPAAADTPQHHAQQPQTHHQPAPAAPADFDTAYQPHPSEPVYEHPQPVAQTQPAPKKGFRLGVPLKFLIIGLAVLILIGAAGYFLTRPAKKTVFTVADLAKKSTFAFYYPQPLPQGYSYTQEINAFQNGQAYFMVANGAKHIIFHEEAASGELDNKSITNAKTVNTTAGKAVVGTTAGQPAARVLAGSTLVSVNTTGSVPVADLTQAINQLKTSK
ncbi:hypothetical protein KW792_01240 [Candidatus Saccharibacteria bacterium]|nr:hypothetical protein [Candidatus Saccharibacteria bacterium]